MPMNSHYCPPTSLVLLLTVARTMQRHGMNQRALVSLVTFGFNQAIPREFGRDLRDPLE